MISSGSIPRSPAKRFGFGDGLAQRRDQLRLVLDRHSPPAAPPPGRRAVDRQRLLQVAEDADVVHDQAVVLARRRPGWPGRWSASGCGSASACRGRSSSRLGTSKPVIHMAQTKTSRNGSSGSLNLVVQVLLHHPLAVRGDVEALLGEVVDLVLLLATRPPPCRSSSMNAICASSPVRSRARARSASSALQVRRGRAVQCFCTLSYIRTAVALSMQMTIALPRCRRGR